MNVSARVALLAVIGCAGCATPVQLEYDAEVNRLCASNGGVFVYEVVRLPPKRFDTYGNIRLPSRERATSSDDYYYELDRQLLRGSEAEGTARMVRYEARIVRVSDKKVLGKSVRYSRIGGDPPGPWHPSSYMCPPIGKDQPSLERSVFLPVE